MMREIEHKSMSGFVMLFVLLAALVGVGWMIVATLRDLAQLGGSAGRLGWLVGLVVALVADLVMLAGVFTVAPNEGRVLQLFGRYVGTAKEPGLRWANPFLTKKRVSLRVRNFETGKLKVNDKRGNPIEFASVVVWKVVEHCRGRVPGRRLQALRACAERGGWTGPGHGLPVRRVRGR